MHIEDSIEERVTKFLNVSQPNMGQALGIEFLSFKRDEIKAAMPVNKNTVQPFGILHGGASVALAETLASVGGWLNLEGEKSAVGVEINANHIRPVRKGSRVIGTAKPIHRGRQTQLWEIEIHTESGKLVCVSRCTLMIVSDSRES